MTDDVLGFSVSTNLFASSGAVAAPVTEARAGLPFREYLRQRAAGFGQVTAANIAVNEDSALRFAAVFASVRVISESKAALPIKVFEVSPTGSETETKSHPVAELLAVEPNADQTPMVYAEFQQSQVLTRGNSFALIHFDGAGQPRELEPIHPTAVEIGRDSVTKRLLYRVQSVGGEVSVVEQSQIVHVPGIGGDGVVGWSVIRMAAESIGIGLANERFAGQYFSNFARPSLILESEGEIGEAYDALQNSLNENYSGSNVGRALLLEGGLKAKTFNIPLNECQFLESRDWQGKEIACRWFRIPAQLAGYGDDAKYDHMEQADLFFAKHTLGPWCTRDEQEYRRKLFRRSDRARFRVRHNMDALQRADIKTRYEAHHSAIVTGWKTINEVRKLEDMNALDGGDELILPQSVFGKQPTAAGSASDIRSDSGGVDPRLALLVRRSVEGLLARELTAAERGGGVPDVPRIEAFYQKHRSIVRERFAGIVGEARFGEINAILATHCEDAKRSGAVAIAGWAADVDRICQLILEPSRVTK